MDNPRLSRSVLYGCGTSVALVLAPQLARIPLWLSGLVVLVLIWKMFTAWLGRHPPRLAILVLSITLAAGVFATYGTFIGRTAGTALLVAMLSMKFLETANKRDAMLVVFLSYFVIVANFLFDQGIWMAAYLLLAVAVCTLTLLTLHTRGYSPSLAGRSRTALRMLAEAIPIAAALFLLFPRISGPLWGVPEDQHSATTGLTDTLTPGSISSLSRSATVAFRVQFDDVQPPYGSLYWRGPVLWRYDGRTWTTGGVSTRPPALRGTSRPVDYTLTLQPHGRRWVFALDAPAQAGPNTTRTTDMQLLSKQPVVSVARYRLSSWLWHEATGPLPPAVRAAALQLPLGFNPATRSLGARFAAEATNSDEIVQRALQFFRERPFVYTLSPPLLGEHAMDEFLFSTRSGFCGHYASSFVSLMRAAGVPARIVTGYMGGENNLLGDYMLVRQSDAHAWAEVWLDGRGWRRIDPTAAVSPARVVGGLNTALPDDDNLPLFIRPDSAWLRQAGLLWDSFNNRWNNWVLGYGPKLQRQLLGGLGLGSYSTGKTVAALVAIVSVLLILVAMAPHWRKPGKRAEYRSYERFCRKVARAGIARSSSEGPMDFNARACAAFPAEAERITAITNLFIGLVYADIARTDGRSRLDRLIRQLRLKKVRKSRTR